MEPIFVPSPTKVEALGNGRFLVSIFNVGADENTLVTFDGWRAEERARGYADWMGTPRQSEQS